MIITDVWSLHFQDFLIQIEGTLKEKERLEEILTEKYPEKSFMIICKGVN